MMLRRLGDMADAPGVMLDFEDAPAIIHRRRGEQARPVSEDGGVGAAAADIDIGDFAEMLLRVLRPPRLPGRRSWIPGAGPATVTTNSPAMPPNACRISSAFFFLAVSPVMITAPVSTFPGRSRRRDIHGGSIRSGGERRWFRGRPGG